MYLQNAPLAKSPAPMRRKRVAPSLGGGKRVLVEFKETPFSRLAPDDLLDTADLCRLFGVSVRTVYRWIAEEVGEQALPRWNFHKYLIGKDGAIAGTFG